MSSQRPADGCQSTHWKVRSRITKAVPACIASTYICRCTGNQVSRCFWNKTTRSKQLIQQFWSFEALGLATCSKPRLASKPQSSTLRWMALTIGDQLRIHSKLRQTSTSTMDYRSQTCRMDQAKNNRGVPKCSSFQDEQRLSSIVVASPKLPFFHIIY